MKENPMSSTRYDAFDSLRAYACTLVVLSHCQILAQGGLGNNIFFTLSGFFSILPFIQNPENRLLSPKGLIKYYYSKLLRIFPPLWISLFFIKYLTPIVYFQPGNFTTDTSFTLNLLMLNPLEHLWFLQQVTVFILIAPLLIYLAVLIKFVLEKLYVSPRKRELIVFFVFLALTLITDGVSDLMPTFLHARGNPTVFLLPRFLLGIACAYLYRFLDFNYIMNNQQENKLNKYKPAINTICTVILILFLVLCILTSRDFLKYIDPALSDYLIGWRNPMLVCSGTFIVILALMFGRDALFIRAFSNKAISYIGQVSFSIYIIHYFLIAYFPADKPIKTFIPIYVLSLGYAFLMDRYVETPLKKIRKR